MTTSPTTVPALRRITATAIRAHVEGAIHARSVRQHGTARIVRTTMISALCAAILGGCTAFQEPQLTWQDISSGNPLLTGILPNSVQAHYN